MVKFFQTNKDANFSIREAMYAVAKAHKKHPESGVTHVPHKLNEFLTGSAPGWADTEGTWEPFYRATVTSGLIVSQQYPGFARAVDSFFLGEGEDLRGESETYRWVEEQERFYGKTLKVRRQPVDEQAVKSIVDYYLQVHDADDMR